MVNFTMVENNSTIPPVPTDDWWYTDGWDELYQVFQDPEMIALLERLKKDREENKYDL